MGESRPHRVPIRSNSASEDKVPGPWPCRAKRRKAVVVVVEEKFPVLPPFLLESKVTCGASCADKEQDDFVSEKC